MPTTNIFNLGVILPIVLGIIIVIILAASYVRVPPDKLLIVSGLRRRSITGKATFVIPFLERKDYLSLKMMSVDVKTSTYVPTNDYINIMVDGAVKIKIGITPEMVELAGQNFLNMGEEEIVNIVKDVLEANMREIIGQMKLQEMVVDRKTFGEKVLENAVPDLQNMGLEIIAFNIQNFNDENNLINELGIENAEKVKKDSAIAKANAKKEIDIETARAEKAANDERVLADTEIARRNNELEIEKAELKILADKKNAEADLAFETRREEGRKRLEEMTAEANRTKTEKMIEVRQNELQAEVNNKANADLYKRTKEAEANLIEQKKEAEAIQLKANAEAEAIRTKGQAEADAARALALAEAEGILKKAEAMKQFGEAAIIEMFVKVLPEVAKNTAEPLSKVNSITMFGEGNSTKLIKDITNTGQQIIEGFGKGLGIDLPEMLQSFLGGSKTSIPPKTETLE